MNNKTYLIKNFWAIAILLFVMAASGCQHMKQPSSKQAESQQEVLTALETVTEGLTNTSISKDDLKRVAVQMNKDPEVKSAVEAVNASFNHGQSGIKYCPKCGKRFASRVEICPIDQTPLKSLE